MRNSFLKSFLVLLIILSFSNGYSIEITQDKIINYIQNSFEIKNQIWGIETNPQNGLVYFATNIGLVEFDGLSFKTQESTELKTIRSISIDANGTIFTGGFETFGYWEKDKSCNLKFHPLSDSVSITKNDEIWKIYNHSDYVIFQSFTTIYIYDYHSIKKITAPGFMLFMFHVNNQFIVQILEEGLYYFKDTNFEFIEGSEQFRNIKIHSIIPFQSNKMLVCTEKSGVYKFDKKTFTYWDTPTSKFLKSKTCNAATQLNDSTLVFGTILDGIIFTNLQGIIEQHYNYGNGLFNNTVLSFCKTKTGGLWIGLDEGTNYINQSSSINYFSTATDNLGTIYSLLKDNNTVYFGSNHGLFKSQVSQKGTNLSFSNLEFVPNSQGQVWTLAKFNNQILCGHNEGTFTLTQNNLKRISDVTGGWVIKSYGDLLLEGTYTGLITFQKNASNQWEYRSRLEGFYEPTRHIEIDYLGYIWVSHPQKGIYQLRVNEAKDSIEQVNSFTHLKKSIGLTDVYKLNNRIVFSTGKEFYTYDYVNNSMVPFAVLNALLGEFKQASQIIPYDKNLYWFIKQNKMALFRISIESEPTKIKEFIIADACMPGQDLAILALNTSDFLISNRNGLAMLKSNGNKCNNDTTAIWIKNAFFHGKNKSITVCPTNKIYTAPFYLNNVTFRFVNPSSVDHFTTKYKYRIKEIDENWIFTETEEIRYYHLKPGTYHLEIFSDANPKILTQTFIINPPWYLTKWAYGFYLMAFLFIVWALYIYFQKKLSRQRKLLEFEVKQTSLENRLQNTNVELMLTLRYLIQKNESLQHLQDEINQVKEAPGNIPPKFIKKLDNQIVQGLELQTKEWKMALHNLKLSQEGYFKRLKENYPKLTNNDIRLCSYLRMNFTSKEIAQLLNISTRAVEISRYRLRKKLSLEHNINLTDFLMQDEL